jgi:hypothetical protein
MASTDLKKFLETRLLVFDPTMDLSPGSPAQTKIVSPTIAYLGTDPFETDIEKFIVDRFAQEFPDLYAGDPGALRDVFINPLRVLLEPFKRETAAIRRSQSLIDPTVLSDDDADALVANVFDTRDRGGIASGVGRAYFPNPTDLQMDLGTRWYSASGLNFFPATPVSITAEEMVFNREGNSFYFDVSVQAEAAGSQYNIGAGDLTGIEGLSNTLRVTNPQKFTGGLERQDTPTFVAAAEASLTERSLVTRRGARARLSTVFKGEVRAIQVIGAKDAEMQRDLLTATSPGHAWITGTVTMYQNIAYVRARTLEGAESDIPKPGDTLYIYDTAVVQERRFVRLKVEELLLGPMLDQLDGYQYAYMVRWSDPEGSLAAGVAVASSFEGGFAKKGVVKVSSIPGAGTVDLTVNNESVHVFGRSDIYVRPSSQDSSTTVLDGIYDLGKVGDVPPRSYFFLEREFLTTGQNANEVTDANPDPDKSINFHQEGVAVGDILYIDQGPDAGPHIIADVGVATLRLTTALTASSPTGGYRYRVIKKIRLNPFDPRIVRFPFGDRTSGDMSSAIGSAMVRLASNDIIDFGAKVGDYLRILDGPDAGTYVIQSFDPVLGGQAPVLDKLLTSTSSSLSYEVYTPLKAVPRPLVRVRELLLLDSAKQSTGLTIPPADPVAVVPTGPFSSARVLGTSYLPSGYVLPDFLGLMSGVVNAPAVLGGLPDASCDRRYSLGFDAPNGIYRGVQFADGTRAELDLRSDTSGACSYFVSTVETIDEPENFPPISPKVGESLTIKTGPNKGSYLIRDVQKFKYRTERADHSMCTTWVYFIRIHGAFPVDPLRQVIDFLIADGVATGLESVTLPNPIPFPSFFSDWYAALAGKLSSTLTSLGAQSPGATAIASVIDAMSTCSYEWGTPAHGVLRTFFKEPTLFEMGTGLSASPTIFSFKTGSGDVLKFRPSIDDYDKQELVPARLGADNDPLDYPRDASISVSTLTFSDVARPTVLASGIVVGDVVSIHEETSVFSTVLRQVIVQTVDGSAQVSVPASAGAVFTPAMVGSILHIEEGPDKGGCRITKYLDSSNVILSKVMTVSSPVAAKTGLDAFYGKDGSGNKIADDGGRPFSAGDVGSYITVFDIDYRWMGSFPILDVANGDGFGAFGTVIITAPGPTDFPTFPATDKIRWVITAAPASAPQLIQRDPATLSQTGTETVAGVPVRIYEAAPRDYPIVNTFPNDATGRQVAVSGTPAAGIAPPYRIYRKDVRRVTPTEMNLGKQGPFVFFDTEVVSLSPSTAANLTLDSYLTVDEGTYQSLGYRHVVADSSYSYSTKEEGFLDLPTKILPVDNADSPDNYISILGAPLQITYETASLVSRFQDFVDSAQDRVLSSDQLVRHFLPSYVSCDIDYVGGDSPSTIAKDLISFIDNTPVETALDVSEMGKVVTQHGGNLVTPTVVSITIYDWDRRVWVEFSANELGGTLTKVPYNGTPRVSFVIPGQDVSGLQTIPAGERVSLVRR